MRLPDFFVHGVPAFAQAEIDDQERRHRVRPPPAQDRVQDQAEEHGCGKQPAMAALGMTTPALVVDARVIAERIPTIGALENALTERLGVDVHVG
jgi:hypothetical protein